MISVLEPAVFAEEVCCTPTAGATSTLPIGPSFERAACLTSWTASRVGEMLEANEPLLAI